MQGFPDHKSVPVNRHSSARVKIALFRSLLRGREDVYARCLESRKSGKSGYQSACGNEWVRGLCEKPRIRCVECPTRRFLAVTDEVTDEVRYFCIDTCKRYRRRLDGFS